MTRIIISLLHYIIITKTREYLLFEYLRNIWAVDLLNAKHVNLTWLADSRYYTHLDKRVDVRFDVF